LRRLPAPNAVSGFSRITDAPLYLHLCCLMTGCADASHGVQQMRKFTAMHSLQCSIIYNNQGTGVSKTRRIKLGLKQLNRLLRSRLSKSKKIAIPIIERYSVYSTVQIERLFVIKN